MSTCFKKPTKEGVQQVDAFLGQGFSVCIVSSDREFPLTVKVATGHTEADIRAEFTAQLHEHLENNGNIRN